MKGIALVLSALLLLPATAVVGQGRGPGGEGPPGGGNGGGNKPPTEETAANSLSYPVILGDDIAPDGWVLVPPVSWTFATVTDPATECYPAVALADATCWYDGAGTWWLQQRPENKWQAPNPVATAALEVTAIDWGDLLESRTNLNTRSLIRVETVLYEDVSGGEGGVNAADLYAFAMSPAIPGTENSPSEMRGTDQSLVDPTTVHPGFHATVYSACVRFLIQKVTGDPADLTWSGTGGQWTNGANAPSFEGSTYGGGFTAEVNVGGNLIYGYNLNMRRDGEGAGLYRLTFVLDGGPDVGGPCTHSLNTSFGSGTELVNVAGTAGPSEIIPEGDARLNGDVGGGLTYIDVTISAKAGGGGGPK